MMTSSVKYCCTFIDAYIIIYGLQCMQLFYIRYFGASIHLYYSDWLLQHFMTNSCYETKYSTIKSRPFSIRSWTIYMLTRPAGISISNAVRYEVTIWRCYPEMGFKISLVCYVQAGYENRKIPLKSL